MKTKKEVEARLRELRGPGMRLSLAGTGWISALKWVLEHKR